MAPFSHLSLSERVEIQSRLSGSQTLNAIARYLHRDRQTIAREVQNNRTFVFRAVPGCGPNNCARRQGCKHKNVCPRCVNRRGLCSFCGLCNEHCPDYEPAHCLRLEQAPFCCNGCTKIKSCPIKRYMYLADKAQAKAQDRLHDVRSGLTLSEEELAYTNQLVSPLIQKGQSIHHIYLNHKDELFCSEKTLYALIDAGLLEARNLDLPRKVRRKRPRRKRAFKVDRACRINRTFDDYQAFLAQFPDCIATQMDSVVPCQGGHKVFLTLFWPQAQFLLIVLRDFNTALSVTAIFDQLEATLGTETFKQLFPVLLTDNGSEFSNPAALERDGRSRVFYCDPLHSNQKAQIERAHEFIRAVLPKGSSFDRLTQSDCDLLCSHINSYRRDSLQGKSPWEAFAWLYGEEILALLNVRKINADEVTLTPRLLNQLP